MGKWKYTIDGIWFMNRANDEFFSLSLSLSLKFVFNVLFFQDPVGGLFRGKLIIFSIKKFLRMKREKRERAFFICPLFAAFHHAFPLLFPPFFSFFFSSSSSIS